MSSQLLNFCVILLLAQLQLFASLTTDGDTVKVYNEATLLDLADDDDVSTFDDVLGEALTFVLNVALSVHMSINPNNASSVFDGGYPISQTDGHVGKEKSLSSVKKEVMTPLLPTQ
ncbi:hypothetical protein MSG28_012174 [Choristoneura fumiferana]|uniref:Uncharacterized protein n=1 Tax=Choristoneura fumiferana TaxID=7141 RepID=A0ACC0KC39_CHOFU|nr:hypothetical protein MSG28_012174 [Choristoneura fumiferana]